VGCEAEKGGEKDSSKLKKREGGWQGREKGRETYRKVERQMERMNIDGALRH
jgi:hypothetical protein